MRLEPAAFFRIDLDRVVVVCPKPYPRYVDAQVCLARFDCGGRFCLLSIAWEHALGFGAAELNGRALRELLAADALRAERTLRRVLSPCAADPVTLVLRGRQGREVPMRCHRRYDPYAAALFIAAQPAALSVAGSRPPSAPGPA